MMVAKSSLSLAWGLWRAPIVYFMYRRILKFGDSNLWAADVSNIGRAIL